MSQYIVISFDIFNDSSCKFHCMTTSKQDACDMYQHLMSTIDKNVLVELLEVSNNFSNYNGHTLYWGPPTYGMKTIQSNNGPRSNN